MSLAQSNDWICPHDYRHPQHVRTLTRIPHAGHCAHRVLHLVQGLQNSMWLSRFPCMGLCTSSQSNFYLPVGYAAHASVRRLKGCPKWRKVLGVCVYKHATVHFLELKRRNYYILNMFINTQNTEVVLFKTTSSSSLRRFRFSLSSMLFIRAFLFPSITPCAEEELTG